MSDIWEWYRDCKVEYRRRGDRDRLRMLEYHSEGFALQETDPQRTLALFTEGRQLAQRLGEPWWVLFYDVWRVIAMTTYLHDFAPALDLAIQTTLELRKPLYEGHPWKIAAYNELLSCYVSIDPLGDAEAIQGVIDFLEQEIPQEPCAHRYVYLHERRAFERMRGNWEEAYRVAQGHLALADRDPRRSSVPWYTLGVVCDLALICSHLGRWDEVAAYAHQAEEMARTEKHSQGQLGEALLWQAVLARRADDESLAQRNYRAGIAHLARVALGLNREAFEVRLIYHELGDNLSRALLVCDQELQRCSGRGMLFYEYQIHRNRCRLLARLGRLRPADLEAAREAAGRLKKPGPHLAELEQLERGTRG